MRGYYYTGVLIVVFLCHSQKFEKMLLYSDSDGSDGDCVYVL